MVLKEIIRDRREGTVHCLASELYECFSLVH